MTDKHELDPALLKAATDAEKETLDPDELASDGDDVIAGVETPSEDEHVDA